MEREFKSVEEELKSKFRELADKFLEKKMFREASIMDILREYMTDVLTITERCEPEYARGILTGTYDIYTYYEEVMGTLAKLHSEKKISEEEYKSISSTLRDTLRTWEDEVTENLERCFSKVRELGKSTSP